MTWRQLRDAASVLNFLDASPLPCLNAQDSPNSHGFTSRRACLHQIRNPRTATHNGWLNVKLGATSRVRMLPSATTHDRTCSPHKFSATFVHPRIREDAIFLRQRTANEIAKHMQAHAACAAEQLVDALPNHIRINFPTFESAVNVRLRE